MAENTDYKKLAKKQFETNEPLFTRYQEDADLFNAVEKTTKLLDANSKEIPFVVITMYQPQTILQM